MMVQVVNEKQKNENEIWKTGRTGYLPVTYKMY